MGKYINRIHDELSKEFVKPYRKNLPFLQAIVVMFLISRAIAESIEIFPYSVNQFLVSLATKWAYIVAPVIDRIYGALGYPFAPDVALMHKLPEDNPIYPLPVWMMALWSFTVIYTFAYWFIFTAITYGIGKAFGSKTSFMKLLTVIGIAHIPLINWWFYVGCEMMYEIDRQEIYLGLFPPYYASGDETEVPTPWGTLPNVMPIEAFWIGFATGIAFMILTIYLLYGLTKRELGLSRSKTILAIIHWLIFLIGFVMVGSFNIDKIAAVLNKYVEEGRAWKWFP